MPGGRRASSGRAGGKATKNPRHYRALKRKGFSEASAARITNAGKKAQGKGGRSSKRRTSTHG